MSLQLNIVLHVITILIVPVDYNTTVVKMAKKRVENNGAIGA
jgi:hypothetical protein